MATSVTLHPLHTGDILVPPGLLVRASGPLADLKAIGLGTRKRDRIWVPVPAFLIEHPEHGPVLVDTGLPDAARTSLRGALGRIAGLLYEVRLGPEQPVLAQLRARGIDPADVRTVVMTHLHFDHASAMPDFPAATFVVEEREWKAANAATRMLNGYHRPLWADAKVRTVRVDGEPWEGFERTHDLFGDGTVRLLATPGHTPGHCSLAIALEGRHALLIADLADTMASVRGPALPGLAVDFDQLRHSLGQLRAHVAEHPDSVLIPGHDPDRWAELEAVYA
ncbi:MAG: N-acyl homoserine lactone hydrolase [Solirubrobacteraceae bacterium]|jgi:glyoxylase-like metal-dependent hydrolase (beta-lactamase superfamily II)|nr:N-acyl homoserine lactone hydrolase [Solirubrobacteraceae bacterium]